MKNRKFIIRLCVWAMMTAIVFIGNFLRITIPVSLGGVSAFTLANILCALSGILLGPVGGFAAAGLGSALYDLTNPAYVADAPLTFLTKGMYGLIAGLVLVLFFRNKREKYFPQLLATICAAVVYIVVYLTKNYFYNAMVLYGYRGVAQCWAYVVTKIPSTVVNGVIAVIFAPILGVAIFQALRKARLDQIFTK